MLKRGRVNLKNLLLIFMVLQSFFDSYVLYTDEIIDLVGFSPTTILRFSLIGLIFVYLFLTSFSKKESKYILLYGIIVFVYTTIHHFICINIDDSVLYGSFRYSLVGELFYLLRLVYPFILMYIVYLMKLSKKEFKFVIQGTAFIFSLILIFMNLSLISQTSYFSKYIKGNIFDWFNSDISRYLLAAKGWFNSANQIGGLILLLVPINFYYAVSNLKKWDIVVFLLLVLACYSIGTRISCVGISLVLIVLVVGFLIFKLFKKEKFIKKEVIYTLIIIVFSLIIFNFAPVVNLSGSNLMSLLHLNKVVNDNSNEEIIILNPDYDGSDICEFLTKTSTNTDYYNELYPCQDNLEFWTDYVRKDYYKYTNNRLMEKLITNEVYQRVKSPMVILFGMSRSRFEGAKIYLERDVIVHYYTLGIIGILLFILPYFVICGYIGIKRLFNHSLDFKYLCLISSVVLPLVVSILTGHIVDELLVTLYVGFVLGYLIYIYKIDTKNNITNIDINDKRKKILFVVDENKMGGVSVLLKDIVKIFDYKKYKIDVLVLHDSGNCLKDLGKNVRVIYGTKFFNAVDYNLRDLIRDKKILLLLNKIYLIFLMKTCLIKYRIVEEREKILDTNYDVEIAFKDGFTAIFTAYGNSKKKIHWLHYEYKKVNVNGNYPNLFKKILPMFDKIVAASNGVKDAFNDIYHLENKTITIENIIDTDKMLKKSKEKCDRKLDNSKFNIVCVGRLHECKGYDRLINSINRLKEKDKKKIKIEIYGDGSEKDKLQMLIDDYNLNKVIYLKGEVSNPYKYIKGNDLFILCSHFESFGLVIVEAMTLGVPVLAVETSNTYKLIDNKVNGYVVDNDDDSLFEGLNYLINNRKIVEEYKKKLIDYKYNNCDIINNIKKLIDN